MIGEASPSLLSTTQMKFANLNLKAGKIEENGLLNTTHMTPKELLALVA